MVVKLPARSWTLGRRLLKTSDRQARTKCKGGKYLILPPGYAEKIPDGSTRCCAPMSGAAMILMSPRRSPTRSRSSDTRCLKPGQSGTDNLQHFFSFAFSSIKHLGSGQFYLVTIRDKDGAPRVSGISANTNSSPVTPTQASSKKVIAPPDVSTINPASVVLNEAPMPTAAPISP